VRKRASDAVESLEAGNHLGALGALDGIAERVRELSTVLQLIQDLSLRKEPRAK
jgi:hypothetical protein